MDYWKTLINSMHGKGYVMAKDLAEAIGPDPAERSSAHPKWQEFCKDGRLKKYKKNPKSQSSSVAYVLPDYEDSFKKNHSDFKLD